MSPAEVAAEAVRRGAVQKEEELRQLLELLLLDPPRVVVEIGAYEGGTLWAWVQLGAAFAIDSGVGLLPGRTCALPVGATLLPWDSHDPETVDRLTSALRGRPADFLFIDGDHTYDGVRRDWEMYGPLVRPGGLVAFHDICHHADPGMGVERLWAEIRGASALELVAEPTWWGGIGVLRR